VFEEWSFIQSIKYKNLIKSDQELKNKVDKKELEISKIEREKYDEISENARKWKRPRMEDIAREMDLKFLYDYGYDYASSTVHPLFYDGSIDFLDITMLEKHDEKMVDLLKSNSILVGTLLLQEGLNNSTHKWMRLIYDAIDGIRNELGGHKLENILPLHKLTKLLLENPTAELCNII
jgi:hypothetical protein